MIKVLELPDKKFTAATITMLQEVKAHTLEMKGKIETVSWEIEDMKKKKKKEPTENFTTEKLNDQNKS